MSICNLVCGDCDWEFSVPPNSGELSEQVCPKCSSTKIFERFGGLNSQCLDAMKECSACAFQNNCNVR